jgi:hypothetical protein
MKRLEEELKHALRREEPSEGFAERVLAATTRKRQGAWHGIFTWPGLRWALAGAMCLMLAVAGMEYKQSLNEQARGEAAKVQLMQALRITADKLQLVQDKVHRLDASSKY